MQPCQRIHPNGAIERSDGPGGHDRALHEVGARVQGGQCGEEPARFRHAVGVGERKHRAGRRRDRCVACRPRPAATTFDHPGDGGVGAGQIARPVDGTVVGHHDLDATGDRLEGGKGVEERAEGRARVAGGDDDADADRGHVRTVQPVRSGRMADADHMRRFWDARARENAEYFVDNRIDYTGGDEAYFWEQGERDLQTMFDLLDLAPAADETVLDVGCGVGRLLKALTPRVTATIGIDVSPEMVQRARENLAGFPVTLHEGDGTSLRPVADASVDGVVSLVVFQHIPDPAITLGYLREIGRVLRPGGWAGVQVSNDPSIHADRYTMPSRLKRALGRAPRGQDDPAWRGSAVTLDAVRAAAADGGCEVEQIVNEGSQFCLVRLLRRDVSS